jgi:hypothetical protein
MDKRERLMLWTIRETKRDAIQEVMMSSLPDGEWQWPKVAKRLNIRAVKIRYIEIDG